MMKRRLSFGSAVGGLLVAMVFSAGAVAPPWDGGKIVFGETEQGGTFSLDSAASASGVYFHVPATLGGVGPLTLVAPAVVYGGGELLTPLAGADGIIISNAYFSSRNVFPQKDSWTEVWPNAILSEVEDIAGEVTGIWSGSGKYWPTATVKLEKASDGLSVTGQFHIVVASGVPRAFKVAFRQNGPAVEAQVIWAKYSADPAKFGQDWDSNPSGTSSYSAPFDTSRICITNLRGKKAPIQLAGPLPTGDIQIFADDLRLRPTADMTISSVMTGQARKISIIGTKSALDDESPCVTLSLPSKNQLTARTTFVLDGIDAKATTRYSLPNYFHLILTNNAVFTDNSPYGNGATFSGGILDSETNTLTISKGSKCAVKFDWSFSYSDRISVEVVVDGGELDLASRPHYLNRLSLANGGRVSCSWFVVGYFSVPVRISSFGEGPNVIGGCVRMAAPNASILQTPYVFDVHSDLHVEGGFKYYTGTDTATFLKTGPATLSVGNKTITANDGSFVPGAPNPFRVEDGRLLLAVNDAFSRTNVVALAGGGVDAGTATNRLGVLTLEGTSSIAVGDGQLTFSDSSAAAWSAGAVLNVTGSAQRLKKGHLRFLPGGGHEGLSAAQLAAVRYNGDRHVKLDGDGWLRSYTPGVTISIK